jgi:four helix bundle protein
MSIASKEARETKYWLRLLEHSQIIKYDYSDYLKEIDEITRILSIVKTLKRLKIKLLHLNNSKFNTHNS